MKAYQIKSKSKNITFNIEEYNSAMELVNTSAKREVTEAWKRSSLDYGAIKRESEWYGVSSYDEALDLLKNGWTEKLDEMKSNVRGVATQMNGKRITFKNNVMGFAPVVPLAMMNVPNSMIDTTIKPIKSKVVKILYNMTMNCATSSETILENGMNVIKAVTTLENSGYRCQIVAMQNYYNRNEWCDVLLLNLKDANQPLDLKRVMFPLIHTAMFRVVGFDWQDKLPTGRYVGGRGTNLRQGLGSYTDEVVKEVFGDNCFYLDGVMLEGKTTEYIEKLLKGEKVNE